MSVIKIISGIVSAAVIFIALALDYFVLGSTGPGLVYVPSPWVFTTLVFVLLLASQYEFYNMLQERGIYPLRVLGPLLGLVYLAFAFMGPFSAHSVAPIESTLLRWWPGGIELYWANLGNLILMIGVIAPMIHFLFTQKREHSLESSMATTFGLLYVIFLGSYMLKIRFQSIEYILLFVCTAKSCDIGAYFIGSGLGRHKFHPESPRKTIEGSIGGMVTGTVVAVVIARLFVGTGFPVHLAVIYGILVCIASQIGDLGESMLKRRCNVKDSGNVIPGSGGMLDFVDCLLFSAPVAYYFVEFAVQ